MAKKIRYFIWLLGGIGGFLLLQACSPVIDSSTARASSNSSKIKRDINLEKILKGQYNASQQQNFVAIPVPMALQKNMYLQKEVVESLKKLNAEAQKNSFKIYIVSATRSYQHQKYIWQAKYAGKRRTGGILLSENQSVKEKTDIILKYSSMPGTSRHHWGTDFDLFFRPNQVSLNNSSFESGEGLKFYQWLSKNAARFGFCQPYQNSPKNRREGFQRGYLEEKWHWSYMPLSKPYTRYAQEYIQELKPSDFAGSEEGNKIYDEYILNIHPNCLK